MISQHERDYEPYIEAETVEEEGETVLFYAVPREESPQVRLLASREKYLVTLFHFLFVVIALAGAVLPLVLFDYSVPSLVFSFLWLMVASPVLYLAARIGIYTWLIRHA